MDDENDVDVHEALKILYEHTNLQARVDTVPWRLGAEAFPCPNSDEPALAPCPGLAYDEYYSPLRDYTRRHKIQRNQRVSSRNCKAQPTHFEFCDELAVGTPDGQVDISPSVYTQFSAAYIETQCKKFQCGHDKHVNQFPSTLQQHKIVRSVDNVTFSVETLVCIFHPCT